METSKKWKRKQPNQGEEDRISNLPDSVLVHILSFLQMEDAVMTGILSRRWEYLWTNVPRLNFYCPYDDTSTKQKEKYIDFVYRTLALHQTNTIEEFQLAFSLSELDTQGMSRLEKKRVAVYASHVDIWVCFAVRRNVKKLCLLLAKLDDGVVVQSTTPYKLSHQLFENDSIRELKLVYCLINRAKPILWNYLKKLKLYDIQSSDEAIQNILNGTPLLEKLTLSMCIGVKNIDIASRNLKMLNIWLSVGSKLKITAPYVHKMKIYGDVAGYTLTNVLSLVDVRVRPYLDHSHDNGLKKLLESVRHAHYLSLDSDCLQVLSMLEVQNLHLSSLNCSTLSLSTNLTKWELPGIVAVLRASSNVQMLIIKEDTMFYNIDFGEGFLQSYDFNEENYWSSLLQTDWLPATLTTVKIYDFKYGSFETELVEFLLKKAQKLQTMVLVCKEKVDFSKDKPVTKDMWNFSQKLLSIRKASPDAVVQFS
ncbi:F-box protein [Thalictrum thalictroides]|uniref:F-box protein n=1 Tax=Thalictrum thalictroides TaxID=46969 RepID=A0A7J6W1E5_THATH|nr:F-box protein [Thalictrum thalictroides]